MSAKDIMDAAIAAAKQVKGERPSLWQSIASWRAGAKLARQRRRCRTGKHDFTGFKVDRRISVFDRDNPGAQRPIHFKVIYKATCMHCGHPKTVTEREG